MKLIDFIKKFNGQSNHGKRGHAQPSALTDIIKDQRGFSYKFLPNEPHVRIEFDRIDNPTVWIDGEKVTALEKMDMHWMARTKKKSEYQFEISCFDPKEESLKAKSVTGNHGCSADEIEINAKQLGDVFAKSKSRTDDKVEKEAKLLADIVFIKGEIEKVADVSRHVKFEEKYLKSDLGYLTKFLQTLGVNCYESETIIYGQTEPYMNIKGLVVLFGDDHA
ncbi:hypothetical protein GKC32_09420 [Lactobacillus curvatus]|nr:hypothetical protein [Latilactobacillus curvatus]MSD84781.1 hypothetical protein [Latilactobacillus curvatus]MSE24663.1 hypothetical protein [Latilactobacillus curvatus]